MSSEKDYSVLPEVTIIQESAKIESEEHKPKKLRVCAYARVSTEKEEQEYSFENQRDYYMDYISKRSDWEFVGIYSDFGLSGKNKKRPQFIKMIDDCHAGKIDRIITKSISRFARNTIDCIQTVRDLREKGIGVYFEREGIDSLSPQSALVLSIMAIVAEEESRSISNNIKWAIQKQFAQGHYFIHTKHFLGYSREEDNRIIIIPKQALAVRSIYQLYLDGKSIHQIALEMELREIESPEGNKNWGDSTILSILKNEKYKGDCLLQKTYSPDFLASKRYKNTGQLRSYYVKSHHAPIISSAMFDEVQNEMQRRKDLRTGSKAYPSKYSGKSCLSGLLICGQCGGVMRRHVQYRKGGGIGYWVCQRHDQGSCSMMQIKEKVIIDGLQMVIRQILFQKKPLYTEMTDTIINSARKAHKSSIKSVNAKIKRVQRQIQQIKDDYIEDAITYEEYCHLSRQFIHTEPFLELEREEMIQENKCLAPIEQRIEEISQRLKLQTLYEHFNEDLVLGGLQKHQTPRTDGISPTLTEAMGKGGGQTPIIIDTAEPKERFYKQAFETLKENECEVGDTIDAFNKKVNKSGVCPTLTTRPEGFKTAILPVVGAMRGRNPEDPSDRTAGVPTEQRLEINEKGLCNALTTVQKDNLVIEEDKQDYVSRRYNEFIEEKGYVPEMFVAYNKTEIKDVAPTLTGQCSSPSGSSAVLKLETPVKVNVANKKGYEEARPGDYVNITYPGSKTKRGRVGNGVAHTLTCGDGNAVITENVRIRKLTPRECLRLMGWKDEQIDKIVAAKISGTQQYRQAGNGIVVQVLESIFKALFLGEIE